MGTRWMWGRALVLFGVPLSLSVAGCSCDQSPGLGKLKAQISLMPAKVDFDQVPLGATKDVTVTVQNRGTDTLHVCLMNAHLMGECAQTTRIDPQGSPFTFAFDNPDKATNTWIVEKGAKRDFTVSFTPVMEGMAAATLVIAHDAAGGPTTNVPVTGIGVQPHLDFSTDMLDFGQVTVAQRKTLTVTLTNATQFNQPVTIAALMEPTVIFGTVLPNGADTPQNMMYQGLVPGGGKLDLKVWYQPPEERMDMDTLHLSYCASAACKKDISVKGMGVKPTFQLIPPTLDFGSAEIGTNSMKTFQIKNVGNSNLVVSGVSLAQGTSTEFAPMPQFMLPVTIPPMMSQTVQVTFTPQMAGDHMGRVEVDTNAYDPMNPMTGGVGYVQLTASGSGASLVAVPTSVNFGTVPVGGMVGRMLLLQNTGNSPLTISNIQLNNAPASITMSSVPSLPAMLNGGASLTVALKFAPATGGPADAQVVVTSNDRAVPMLNVPVMGVGGVANSCSISVIPSTINFGLVERGRTVTLPAEIKNIGMQPCNLMNIRLMGMPQFTAGMGADPMVNVPPGGTHRVDINYTPDAYGMHTSTLEFQSDDPAQSMVMVSINGASSPSALRVVPSTLNFGVVPATCRSPLENVTLYNTGSDPITVQQVYLDASSSPAFELQPYTTPTTIPAGGSSVIGLRYHPMSIGMDSGVLFIVTSISPAPIAVPLLGDGEVNATVTDTFQQVSQPKVDVLFVVDNSRSMAWAQSSLGSNLGVFLMQAQMTNADYHIAATTTDTDGGGAQGRFIGNPKVITNSTPNALMSFQATVNVGTDGSGYERGLEAAYLALSDPLINTDNAGFLRPEAGLAIIVVSDDDDSRQDPGLFDPPNPGGPNEVLGPGARPVNFYVNFFRNIKGFQNTGLMSFNAVVELTEGSCDGSNDNAETAGWRYQQVSMQTGGLAESICDPNWGQTLTNIGLASFGLRRQFQLSSQPVVVTIAVSVNNMMVPQSSWTYDMGSNTVTFQPNAVPPAGATISITYTVACLN